ncbi:MAG: heme oxygenase [Pedobacter sp.]|nr:MAG: heme oxygenase [Pedobacter sp.]
MLSINIKEQTKAGHLELEKTVVKELKAIRSDADYAAFLKKFYTYFSQVEQVISPYITEQLLPDYADRRNSSYLKNDIEALGGTVNDIPKVAVPDVENTLQALGALYVMEGSIMGGRIIVQMLEKGGITKGVSFFSGYGAATGERWSLFTDVMNAQAKNDFDEKLAIDAANQTFSDFGKVF